MVHLKGILNVEHTQKSKCSVCSSRVSAKIEVGIGIYVGG